MKIYKLHSKIFQWCNSNELLFEMTSDERLIYFEDSNDPCGWSWAYWFNNNDEIKPHEAFCTEDLGCWYDRNIAVNDDLLDAHEMSYIDTFLENAFLRLVVGVTMSISKHRRYNVSATLLYEGPVENCPQEYRFNKEVSEREV